MSKSKLPNLPKAAKEMSFSEIYNFLSGIDIDLFAEKKKDKKYLQWATAWTIIASYFDVSYKICQFDGKDYSEDQSGALVRTEVTINGVTLPMVMALRDASNKCQKSQDYEYTAKDFNKKDITKVCKAFTAFDITNAHMRCLTKNLSMFGLGYKLYLTKDHDFSCTDDVDDGATAAENVNVVTEAVSADTYGGFSIQQLISKCYDAKKCDDIRFIGQLLKNHKDLANSELKNIYIKTFKSLPDFK